MQLVLHIGMHKTGTSAIQAYCQSNRQHLRAQGVAYPTGLFKEYPGQHSELYDLANTAGTDGVAEFASQLHASHAEECDTIFLSGERLCVADKGLATSIVKGLLAVFDHIDIVFVVRNKPDYLYSSFNQHLRFAPYTVTFQTFIKRMRYAPRGTFDSWNTVMSKRENVEFIIMNYDVIRTNLIPLFFKHIFGGRIKCEMFGEPNQHKNVAIDHLTASILNTLFKGMSDKRSSTILECYRQVFDGKRYQFPIEAILKQELNASYSDEGWYLPGYEDWYEGLIRLKPAVEETRRDPEYLDDLIEFLNLVRETK